MGLGEHDRLLAVVLAEFFEETYLSEEVSGTRKAKDPNKVLPSLGSCTHAYRARAPWGLWEPEAPCIC